MSSWWRTGSSAQNSSQIRLSRHSRASGLSLPRSRVRSPSPRSGPAARGCPARTSRRRWRAWRGSRSTATERASPRRRRGRASSVRAGPAHGPVPTPLRGCAAGSVPGAACAGRPTVPDIVRNSELSQASVSRTSEAFAYPPGHLVVEDLVPDSLWERVAPLRVTTAGHGSRRVARHPLAAATDPDPGHHRFEGPPPRAQVAQAEAVTRSRRCGAGCGRTATPSKTAAASRPNWSPRTRPAHPRWLQPIVRLLEVEEGPQGQQSRVQLDARNRARHCARGGP